VIQTAWLKPASTRGGQDHLAVQALSEALYRQLVPGITNLTNRARYYSFYPWLLWRYEQHRAKSSLDLSQTIRRGECLLALVTERHARNLGDADHAFGVVGSVVISRALRDTDVASQIDLGRLARRHESGADNSEIYFLNEYGGLGQYYRGPLQLLGLFQDGFHYTLERAEPIARAFDAAVPGQRFFALLEHGVVTLSDLDEVQAFCMCGLGANSGERDLLKAVFFEQNGPHPVGTWQRDSLGLFLDLVKNIGTVPSHFENTFRAALYTGSVDAKTSWGLSPHLESARHRWAVYERGELLAVAAQALFWAALRPLEEHGGRIPSMSAWEKLMRDEIRQALGAEGQVAFSDAVDNAKRRMPKLIAWADAGHEAPLGDELPTIASENTADAVQQLIVKATTLNALLVARSSIVGNPYAEFGLSSDYLGFYPVNLAGLALAAGREWNGLSVGDVCFWVMRRWGVENHLRVALRKLHQESYDTFCVRPTDTGFVLAREIPGPTFTSPRIRTSFRILRDLGLVSSKPEGFVLSDQGEQMRVYARG
jgi:hypothetical protein